MNERYSDAPRPWHAEIVALHTFFQRWLDGTLPATDAAYARLVETTAPGLLLITPEGTRVAREPLLAQFRTAHGSRPGWQMWIEHAALRFQQDTLTVATYEEWQRHADGVVTGRLSTVIFQAQPGTPNGLAWLHVHETWLPVEKRKAFERKAQNSTPMMAAG